MVRAAKIRIGYMRQIDDNLAVLPEHATQAGTQQRFQREIFARLGVRGGMRNSAEALPFLPHDITAGTESELAAAVVGTRATVDLPQAVAGLPFYRDAGRASFELERWLVDDGSRVWEYSWVRIPRQARSNAPWRSACPADSAAARRSGAFACHKAGDIRVRGGARLTYHLPLVASLAVPCRLSGTRLP